MGTTPVGGCRNAFTAGLVCTDGDTTWNRSGAPAAWKAFNLFSIMVIPVSGDRICIFIVITVFRSFFHFLTHLFVAFEVGIQSGDNLLHRIFLLIKDKLLNGSQCIYGIDAANGHDRAAGIKRLEDTFFVRLTAGNTVMHQSRREYINEVIHFDHAVDG